MDIQEELRAFYGVHDLNPEVFPEDAEPVSVTRPVLKDEPDPFGIYPSICDVLRRQGIPYQTETGLRDKFLLSSTTFDPSLFMRVVHRDTSFEDLKRGGQYLTATIEQQSEAVKNLVENHFERFVRAKSTIDEVYKQMRDHGTEPAPPAMSPRSSRRTSGIAINFRKGSRGSTVPANAPAAVAAVTATSAKINKNALRKETEYGVHGIKNALSEVSLKAEEIHRPAIEGAKRARLWQMWSDLVHAEPALIMLGQDLEDTIEQKDYKKALDLYDLACRYRNEIKALGEQTQARGEKFDQAQTMRVVAVGKMWIFIHDKVLSEWKKSIFRQLSNVSPTQPYPGATQAEEHMELIKILLHIGVDENPIWVYLLGRFDYLKNRIAAVVERAKIEIEALRRHLASGPAPSADLAATFLRRAAQTRPEATDRDAVNDLWQCIVTYVVKLLSTDKGLLGEVVDFWDSAQAFIDGSRHRDLPSGYEGKSSKHHQLSSKQTKTLMAGTTELVGMLRDAVISLFADPPTEDISALFSPLPPSAGTPATPLTGAAFSVTEGRLDMLDPEDIPASATKKGESWEAFAFWPPGSNALSATHYLQKILTVVGTAAADMLALDPVSKHQASFDKTKTMTAVPRERSMRAICEAWSKDAEHCTAMEDWIRARDKRDQTKMPVYFQAFETHILVGLQQVLYLSDIKTKPEGPAVITAPPSALVQMVRSQFVNSIYKAISGMVDNTARARPESFDGWVVQQNWNPWADEAVPLSDKIDATSREVRILLTLSNLKAIRCEVLPSLIQTFESSFSVNIAAESKMIMDAFSRVESKLFHSFTAPVAASLADIIKSGIGSPSWIPKDARPDQVSPFIYRVLNDLVSVHAVVVRTVSDTDASDALLGDILRFLVEEVSQQLLEAFTNRQPNTYPLPALMQATLDTEFFAQVLFHYASPKAEEIKGQIYAELDKRTTTDAPTMLQQELTDMRVVLKNLREYSRLNFTCFRRQRA